MTPKHATQLMLAALVLAAAGCREAPPETPIGRAAATGDLPAMESLLRAGIDPNQPDGSGGAPLHVAARNGRVAVVRALLEAGARVDLRDGSHGWTPLMHAIHKDRNAAALALLDGGADPNGRNWTSTVQAIHTTRSAAKLSFRDDAAEIQRRGTSGFPPLVMAAGYGNTEIVRALLQHGADPYVDSAPGLSVLWAAVGGGAIADITDGPPLGTCFPDTVQVLLERAPDLKLEKGAVMTRVVRLLGRSEKCRQAFALIERGARS